MQAMEKEKKMSKNNPELSRYVGRSRRQLALVVVAFMILFGAISIIVMGQVMRHAAR